jgi:uncharacterized protein with HEPN domain
MPPTAEDRLLDILEAIADIDKMLAGCHLEQFAADKMRRMATERCLEIVCEAARKLPDNIKKDERDIDWRKMNDFGNRLRHAYHETDVDIVWDIVPKSLAAAEFVRQTSHSSGWKMTVLTRPKDGDKGPR